MSNRGGYSGRFAPSPTGPLHAGSLVAALAGWLDARAHAGQWLVRIEDVDTPRCIPGASQTILAQLAACGLEPDAPVVYQSQRSAFYGQALDALIAAGLAYPCACTRQDIALALAASGTPRQRTGELVYPGTCRGGLHGRPARAWRLLTAKFEQIMPVVQVMSGVQAIESIASALQTTSPVVAWHDRRLGPQSQDVGREVGDFVLRRADGLWAYQLAVVVDDAAQGVTHVVRGKDLADNTARQIVLQRALGLPQPLYLHTPLVLGSNGEKLSKQNDAQALDVSNPLTVLREAGAVLGITVRADTPGDWLALAVKQWRLQLMHTQPA